MQGLIITSLILGILLILFFIYLQILQSRCTTKITGKFLRTNHYPGNSVITHYAPVFQYTFNNETYEKQTFQSFSERYITKHFISNKEYSIYINIKKPEIFIVDNKFQLSDLVILGTGLFFIIFSILGFLV